MTMTSQQQEKMICGMKVLGTYEELGELRYFVQQEVVCVKREKDWMSRFQVGETFPVIRYSPKKQLICIDFENGCIGWYPITHFDYDGKPEELKIKPKQAITISAEEVENLEEALRVIVNQTLPRFGFHLKEHEVEAKSVLEKLFAKLNS